MNPAPHAASRTPYVIPQGDGPARHRIRHSLGESLIVEASAGTGKTTELTSRIVEVLGEGLTTVDRMVAVTFTHKAAGELKIRLRQKLDAARQAAQGDRQQRLEQALEELEEASIGTIHGFCAQLLRARPVEACVDPAFEELTGHQATRLFDRAFDSWFQAQLDAESPGLRRALARLAWRESWQTGPAIEELKRAARNLIEWRDFTALWEEEPFDRRAAVDDLLRQARALAAMSSQCTRSNDNLVWSIRPVCQQLDGIDRGRVADIDTLEAILLKLERELKKNKLKKGTGSFASGLPRETVLRSYDELLRSLERFREDCGVLLACQLQREMLPMVDRYSRLKAQSGKLDFLDLLYEAAKLLRSNAPVRSYFQNRFTHIFVDEFQDTDPLQAEVLLLLSAFDPSISDWQQVTPAPGKLFLVGDPKQSVYKFRRADVQLYRRISDNLVGRGVARVALTTSYRAVLGIQQFVNAAFSRCMDAGEEHAQAAYSPLDESGPQIPGQPAVVALPVPAPYGDFGEVTKKAINESLPAATAAYIDWLLNESRWKVRENGDLVPIASRHICILFRRFLQFREDITRPYVKGLETRGIPHLLVGSRTFHHREEIEAVRTALTAIEWPEDELAVFAALKGSLFAISDELLFRFRIETGGALHPFRKLGETAGEFDCIRDALRLLGSLHRERNRRPVADTINALLEHVRAHAGFALRPGGQQVLANVHRLCDLARGFESSGGVSFRAFIGELEAQAEKDETPEAPVLEEASEGVRLMTVHNAKGLEFPIVILADVTANICRQEPERYIDATRSLCATQLLFCSPRELLENQVVERSREEAEGVRVCYVAATRAKDLLVVPAVGDQPFEGWLSPLNSALYPAKDAWRRPDSCSYLSFAGRTTVLTRPQVVLEHQEYSVMPGLHAAGCGVHQVLWHDPATLDLDTEETFGMPHISILKNEGASVQSLASWNAWASERQRTLAQASTKSLDPLLPVELGEAPRHYKVDRENIRSRDASVSGRSFGTLVHAVLRDVSPNAARDEIVSHARLQGLIVGAGPSEQDAAVAVVERVLAHPLWKTAVGSSEMLRELPVSLRLDGSRMLDGVLDLAYMSNEGWVVVDYKTDVDIDSRLDEYENQLRWYLHALSSLTGHPARGVLLQV